MGLFGKSTFLEQELEAWSLETWGWLMRALGGVTRLRRTPLVLANTEFFPRTDTEGDERGRYVFETVKGWMGMADLPGRLESYDRGPINAHVATYAFVRAPGQPLGLSRVEEGEAVITYARDLLDQPRLLIPTLAHELSHYLVAGALTKEPAPGGPDALELTTELCVAYAGFGVFAANAAFHFEGHHFAGGHGWSSRRLGYFSERSWAFALAVFLALKGEEAPADVLKPSVADLTNKAARYLSRNPGLLEPLRRIA